MTRPRWEYMQTNTLWPKMAGEVSKMDEEWHALEIGRNGWELVTVVRTPSGTLTAFFKRLIEEPPPNEEVVFEGREGKIRVEVDPALPPGVMVMKNESAKTGHDHQSRKRKGGRA